MTARIILFVISLLPWISLFFVSKKTIKRYMPVTIFTSFLMTIIFQIAYTYKWWVIYEYIVPWGYMIDVSFAYGVFAVGTFWIFILTSHNLKLYLIVNLIMDVVMCYITLPFLNKMGIAEYKNISPWQYLLVIYGLSLMIFVYHNWQKQIFSAD
ncbi:hypothetical protein [Bacillus infantis]|uniref:hypothetical protein n=1 Tax=Bacillus infantis TaxID=324767 RepID=UPI0020A20A31|nr:hypothetical protein [Bacillus infantis]MCP1161278.1 hypothetical protein [Bacillus infantis]